MTNVPELDWWELWSAFKYVSREKSVEISAEETYVTYITVKYIPKPEFILLKLTCGRNFECTLAQVSKCNTEVELNENFWRNLLTILGIQPYSLLIEYKNK